MSIPVTRTKIVLPRRRPDLLTRQHLIDLLMELLENRLTIIAAPAGSGKTTLMIETAHWLGQPVAWLALDPLDRDIFRFLTYLVASIHQAFPQFGKQSALLLEAMTEVDLDLDRLVTAMVNEAYETIDQHFVVMIDDYHFVDDQEDINYFLSRFIQSVDENCHIAISSRTLLSLPDLPLMVARSQVGGLGFEELAFSADEIRNLLQQNYKVSVPEHIARQLADETEGWITGLLLSTHNLWGSMTDRLRVARVSNVGLYEYLAQQVLDKQTPAVRDFLLRTSLLEEFDEELCREVLIEPRFASDVSWRELMDLVLRHNLFVIPIGEQGTWLRYHHLFRDFLQSRLSEQDPEEEKRILQKLAIVYGQRGEWEKAHALYQRLGKTAGQIELIMAAGSSMINTGRMATLANWIDALPSELVYSHPTLLSLRGGVAILLGEIDRGIALLDSSEAALRAENNSEEIAKLLLRRAEAKRLLGKYSESLMDLEEAISIVENIPALQELLAELLRSRAICLHRMGRSSESIDSLKRAVIIFDRVGQAERVALAQIDQGMIYHSLGDYGQARIALESALKHWRKIGDLAREATVLNNLGVLHHYLGDYSRALDLLEQAMAAAQQSGYFRIQALSLASIGDIYRDLDAPDAATRAYQQAYEIAERIHDNYLLFYLSQAEIDLNLRRGDLVHAQEALEIALRYSRDSNSHYEEGLCRLKSGKIALALKNLPMAIQDLDAAYKEFSKGRQRNEELQSILYLALAYYYAKEMNNASEALSRGFQLAEELGNPNALIVIGREVKPVLEYYSSQPGFEKKSGEILDGIAQFEANVTNLRRRIRRTASTIPFSPPKVTIRALGRVQVLVDGKPIPAAAWHSPFARDLLFLLLAKPEGLTKEMIANIFWPDSSPNQVKVMFKNTIYRLRHALEQDAVVFEDEVYRFNTSLDYEYDVEIFTSMLDQAKSIHDPAKQMAAYKAATRLYKGIYLPDITGTWVVPERERLLKAYTEAMLYIIKTHIEYGEFNQAIDDCHEVLSHDHCLEEAYRQAMIAYAALGNKAAVAHQFELCRQSLIHELNLTPSPQTVSLYESLIR
jgi:LuxR family maltose regulon positive regulatory protein